MTGRGLIDRGRLKGCLSITVTFLHCQRPEMLGYFSDLELMWVFAKQLFQCFGHILALSILVSPLHNCSGSCYRCTKPLPLLSFLPSLVTVLKTCSFQGIKCRMMWLAWKHLPPVVLEHKFHMVPLSPKRTPPVLGSCDPQCPQLFPSLPLDAHGYLIPHAKWSLSLLLSQSAEMKMPLGCSGYPSTHYYSKGE